MFKNWILKLTRRQMTALYHQKGQSIIIITFAFLGLIAMLGLALDLGLVYIESVRVNRVTDAAALAAVVELPYEQDAMNRAIDYIRLNGYDVGGDTEILIRGCATADMGTFPAPDPDGGNVGEPGLTLPFTNTTLITGALYIPAIEDPPKATFVIDTGSYQAGDGDADDDEECDVSKSIFGTANKLRVAGRANVHMNFMQFFGFREVPVQDESIVENVTSLDVVVVFDVSGSMEYETTCYDCWVRTSYHPNFPNNGYFNPLPFNAAINVTPSYPNNQSIPASPLCTDPPTPHTHLDSFSYLVHEAELYSREVGDWRFEARRTGQGFWVIQRGSRSDTNSIEKVDGGTNNEGNWQGNQAGTPNNQSSNVCGNPNDTDSYVPGIDCREDLPGGGTGHLCANDPGSGDIALDCSAYIKAHPYATYSQGAGSDPRLQGATYNDECFTSGANPLTGECWKTEGYGPAPSDVPWVEYDFTPSWSGNTHIWIRAVGGGERAEKWRGIAPSSLSGWEDVIYWQVDDGTVFENNDADRHNVSESWRDNRADTSDDEWDWIKLGSVSTSSGAQYILKLFQGSAGYKVDKIVFTNNPGNGTGDLPWGNNDWGPRATPGSATREACNSCNPAFGYTIGPADCTCKLSGTDNANGGYGSGGNTCTNVLTTTNQFNDDLYNGIEPIRSAQEAVKNFAKRLNPKFDQLGFVAFTGSSVNNSEARSKLQCLVWAAQSGNSETGGNVARCYDDSLGTPISYTNVMEAIEYHWPRGGTNISEGLREGLEILGVSTPGNSVDSDCDWDAINDREACDRRGAARKVLILLTDGSPNNSPGGCTGLPGYTNDLWNGEVGDDSRDYVCAMYYAWQAAQNNVTLYTIGLGAGVNSDFLTALATGVDPHGEPGEGDDEVIFNGRGGQFKPAAKTTDLDRIFGEILSNIYVRIVG